MIYFVIVNNCKQVYLYVSIKSVIDDIKLFVECEYISFFIITVFMSTKVYKKKGNIFVSCSDAVSVV